MAARICGVAMLAAALAVASPAFAQITVLDSAQDQVAPTEAAPPPVCGTQPISIARMAWPSAELLAAPLASSDAHRAAVAERLGLQGDEVRERLYADLPDQAQLSAAPAWGAQQLIARYNLALAQGLLLFARSLTITIADADTGMRRRLLKALRFRRLLADVRGDARQALCLEVSGPGSVLDQHSNVIVAPAAAGGLAGFGIMKYHDDEAHLLLLAVQPGQRRRGLGATLVAWLEASARVAGIGTIYLEARASNGAARAFYRHLGYREIQQVNGYYSGREASVRLARDLWEERLRPGAVRGE